MTAPSTPIFEIKVVSKLYGKTKAIENISFSIADGEFLTVIGPSGGGKSTILKMMAGIVLPSKGELLFRGHSLSTMSPGDHRMVMVWQSLALFPHMNVEKNVSFGLSVRKVPKEEQRRRTAASLEMMGLGGYQSRHIQELSGGEQQRVALARALIVEPEMILLDEPFGALDVHLRVRLLEKIREIHHTTGLTFVMVTHDQAEALYISTRIAVLSRGRLDQIGTPYDILHRPQTSFVANFVGRKNVIDATVLNVGGSEVTVATEVGEFVSSIPDWIERKIRGGMRVSYVIDAHKVEVGPGKRNHVRGRLIGRALDGSREFLEVRLSDQHSFKCERSDVDHPDEPENSEISLRWNTEDAYVVPEPEA